MKQQRKLYQKWYGWLTRLDTRDARKILAEDARKSSNFLLGLSVVMLPGLPSFAVKLLGKALEVDLGAYSGAGNKWVFALMLAVAILLRVVAFVFGSKWPGDDKKAAKETKSS